MTDRIDTQHILTQLRRKWIKTERDAAFTSHLNRLLEVDATGALTPTPIRYSEHRETRGVMVIDGPGGGKSTLVSRSLSRHPALGTVDGHPAHYLDASVPSPATFKSMGRTLLERSGYPLMSTTNREGWSIWQTLRGRLQNLGITALWIDEAHDLFCSDRNLILRAIKSLMQGDDAVIVILSGTERLREIVHSDPQVQRRFSTLNLPSVSDTSDREKFKNVIGLYCETAGLAAPIDDDLIPRLFHASRYRFGRCIETLIGAIECALNGRAECLDIGHFAEFWALQEGCPIGRNIFEAPDWASIIPDAPEDDEDIFQTPKRRRRRNGGY